ncbi:hypothetical protein M409DRAFT_58904 [Zasmidium cellare ATCC 36951]|uniref:PHD-type domain-containing protein n=1 Tax=Zasmidium cellare ATCC 36951 TaxID=1080233 RepID=A0A6A6C3W3_ZASCE|nr:uncharacterized protein M409DRAFT_58904 [Zasmidium cellare ATCC 36951]KAF2161837.1 hypothetical protein M409DRAFT_58904 [Zasmidium cellare ATCC 36951]
MPRYKRTRDEAEMDLDVAVEPAVPPEQQETLTTLRNMWEFASLMQYIFLFGQVVKIDDDFDIEMKRGWILMIVRPQDLETECLKPSPSDKLAHIGLQLLKYVSSHRGLTPEIFDEYTRRQYLAKAPQRNPFGDDEEPVKFNDMDVFTRIKVLQQLSTWTLGNAERIRGMMPQDEDHLSWRMEPLGWDKDDRSYYVLDDNRLYCRTDEPPPPPSPKPKAKAKSKPKAAKSRTRGTRASKRRKIEDSEDDQSEQQVEDFDETMADSTDVPNGDKDQTEEEPGFGFTSKTWECIAITLEEYQDFMASIFRSRDPNEKQLRSRIEEDVLPIIEKRAEALRQKQFKKIRELENLQKMATAKRSSRLAGKAEKEKQEREEREVEEKRQRELKMAHEEQDRQRRIEEGHESRRLTREQRVREREAKRILHEEELAKLEDDALRAESQDAEDAAEAKRASERQRKTQKEQHKKELEKLAEDDGNWYFDCSVCGKHGENMDDGTHSIACDRCSVWQHSKCHGFSPKQAESDGFTFICGTCKRKEQDAKKPKIPPLKLHNRGSGSPESQKAASRPTTANGQQSKRMPDHVARQLDHLASQQPRPSPGPFGQLTNGPSLSPHGQAHGPPGYRYPPIHNFAPQAPQQPWQGSPLPPPGRQTHGYGGGAPQQANGYPPSHHQQQHLYAHQSAVASSGAHPSYYQQQYAPLANGYIPRPPTGMYPATQQPQQQYYPPPQSQHHPRHNPEQQTQRPGSAQLMNGFQSPAKAPAKPIYSSPPQQRTQPHGAAQGSPSGQSQQQTQQLQQSPRTNLPPPESHQRGPLSSPVKSSPHQQQPLPPINHQNFSPPRQAQTPHIQHQSTANGHQSAHRDYQSGQLRTPQQMLGQGSTTDATNANKVAADGMSGPWPEGSSAIPQKHQSPAQPPAAVHSLSEKKVFPPETPLVPRPHQQAASTAGNIPVKKLPEEGSAESKVEMNGIPPRPPSHPEMETQAQQQPGATAPTLPPIQPPPQQ